VFELASEFKKPISKRLAPILCGSINSMI